MLAPVPDPDTPDWRPKHHAVPTEAAALHRRRWAPSAGAEPGHDLLADPDAMVEVARILRAAEVGWVLRSSAKTVRDCGPLMPSSKSGQRPFLE